MHVKARDLDNAVQVEIDNAVLTSDSKYVHTKFQLNKSKFESTMMGMTPNI